MALEDTPTTSEDFDDDFTVWEKSVMGAVQELVATQSSSLSSELQHRIYLGAASELIDAAADIAAVNAPGMLVVQLGLLEERIRQLACRPNGSVTGAAEEID